MQKTPIEQVARVARLYRTNKEASSALGITVQAFSRLCRQHDIETPGTRRLRRRRPVPVLG